MYVEIADYHQPVRLNLQVHYDELRVAEQTKAADIERAVRPRVAA